ncbi:MAG TPA: chromosomal replication initiator protein DnaA [Bacteriovoracaceae bacterium]|nr:chromosomal replication initiator protein DnaA [Bacteriovoracaceae bacterium]
MAQKFPFNHFLKLDLDEKSPQVTPPPAAAFEIPQAAPTQSSSSAYPSEFSAEELQSITQAILENIKGAIAANKFHAYFSSSLTVSSISADTVEFLVTTKFIKQMIETHYQEHVKKAVIEILGKPYHIEFHVLGAATSLSSNKDNILKALQTETPKRVDSVKNASFFIDNLQPTHDDLYKAIDSKIIEHESPQYSTQIDTNKTFANFIIGPSNNIAHAFSMAVAKDPGKAYPALYIFGNSGLGKTHLIHAIANDVQSRFPHMRICLTSANRFMNEMVEAIKSNTSIDFRKKYSEKTDLLIIDDIHELKNKTTTQEMFFHIFNELIDQGKQLVFTSDKTPKEIDGLEDRIRTRLSQALPVEIQQPDLETRIAILKKKALEKDLYLDDKVVDLIAKCVKTSVRELEGCLIKLQAVTSILKVDIDLEVAKEHLKLNEELENQRHLTIESITKSVSNYFKIPLGDVRGKAKTKEVVMARQISMYLVNKMLKPTLKDNGKYFSDRDHSTVIHAITTISNRIKTDPQLAQQILELEKNL